MKRHHVAALVSLLCYCLHFSLFCFGLIWLQSSSCLSCLSFLITQTQNLKDVSTAWQVRTNMSFFSIFHLTHIEHVRGVVSCRPDGLVHVSVTCLFFFFLTGLETFLGWLTKALNDFTSEGHKDRPQVHLTVDTYGAETLSSYPGLDTHSHTHWEEDYWRHTSPRTTLKLAFVPERHFEVTNGANHSLNTLNHCAGRSFMTLLSCFTTKQYWIQPLRCCKMYLPVHFVYKKPGTGIGIFCTNSIVYSYNPECTVTK